MKIRHNKKRNTAFIYESLIKEATAAMLKQDKKRHNKVVNIIKKHFTSNSLLKVHLDCYRSLYETKSADHATAQRILNEAKIKSRLLDAQGLLVKQSDLIDDVNKELSSDVYNTFVPNYKTLATISHIFSHKLSPKNTIMLENQIINHMTKTIPTPGDIGEIDNVVFKSFVDKFNQKYNDELLQEQKELLNYYIASFADNSLSLKTFLNEEIGRLKTELKKSLDEQEIKHDERMVEKTNLLINKLSSFYENNIDEQVLLTVMKTQTLVKEIFEDGNKD
jgi:TRAP-type mannitol/chloroaromatic compound transport system substrate-binding protein